ncbi:MAG: hypothetical protein ACRES9_08130 [Gammaproteobacteria bacterium]
MLTPVRKIISSNYCIYDNPAQSGKCPDEADKLRLRRRLAAVTLSLKFGQVFRADFSQSQARRHIAGKGPEIIRRAGF